MKFYYEMMKYYEFFNENNNLSLKSCGKIDFGGKDKIVIF